MEYAEAQGAILDAIAEVFEPISSKIKKVRGVHATAGHRHPAPNDAEVCCALPHASLLPGSLSHTSWRSSLSV